MLIQQTDIDDYRDGYNAAQNNVPLADRNTWWYREGWNQAAAKWLQIGLVVGSPPPNFKPFSPVFANEVAAYVSGYQGTSPALDPSGWWYRVGAWDRANGQPRSALQADLPPPAFRAANPSAPPPVANQQPGQPDPAAIFSFPFYQLTPADLADYAAGWQSAATGRALPTGASWWLREGAASQPLGRPRQLASGAMWWSGRAPFDMTDVSNYQQGFARGGSLLPSQIPALSFQSLPFWYRQGLGDASSGRGYHSYAAGQLPVGFPVVVGVLPALPSSLPTTPLVSAPCLELLVTFFGKPVAYNSFVSVAPGQGGLLSAILGFGIKFEILGDAPGDSKQGFRLSGPKGPIARKIAAGIATGAVNPNPAFYGLPAWVGTHLSNNGIKLLGQGELQAIGVWDSIQTYQPNF